jgi:hypothetical protein
MGASFLVCGDAALAGDLAALVQGHHSESSQLLGSFFHQRVLSG